VESLCGVWGWRAARRVCLPALAAAITLGCESSQTENGEIRVVEREGRTHLSNPPPDLLAGARRWRLEEQARIGSIDGDRDAFGNVIAVALGDAGEIYVADGQARVVRVFDSAGGYLRTLGARGSGPGEFRMISGIALDPREDLWVMDPMAGRLTVFDSSGELRGTVQRSDRSRSITLPWGGRFDRDGHLYDQWRGDGPEAEWEVVRYAVSAERYEARERIPLPPREIPRYRLVRGPVVQESAVPFAPERHWAPAGSGEVWLTDSGDFVVHRLGPGGDTVRTAEIRERRRPIPRATIDSVRQESGFSRAEIPEHFPGIRRLVTGDEGHLWMEVDREEIDGEPSWFVLGSDGRLLGAVRHTVPVFTRDVRPVLRGGRIAGVVEDDLGVQRVVVALLMEEVTPNGIGD
jgi:hypothetical protein